jgi:hypothetical protein
MQPPLFDTNTEFLNLCKRFGGVSVSKPLDPTINSHPDVYLMPIEQVLEKPLPELITMNVRHFGASEHGAMMNDPGLEEYSKRLEGAIDPMIADYLLAAYLQNRYWLEGKAEYLATRISQDKTQPKGYIIGLSPQGVAARVTTDGYVEYSDLSKWTPDTVGIKWTEYTKFKIDPERPPLLCSVDGDTVVFYMENPSELCVIQLNARPHIFEDKIPKRHRVPMIIPIDLEAPGYIRTVTANRHYAVVVDDKGSFGIFSLRNRRLLTPSFVRLEGPAFIQPAPTVKEPAMVNPLSDDGAVLEPEPIIAGKFPEVHYPVCIVQFNELNPFALALCTSLGPVFTCNLPVLKTDNDIVPQINDIYELGFDFHHDLLSAPPLLQEPDIRDLPVQHPASCVSFRKCADDMTLAFGGVYTTNYRTTMSKYSVLENGSPLQTDRALEYRSTRNTAMMNTIAAFGSSVVTHTADGRITVWSMQKFAVEKNKPVRYQISDFTGPMPIGDRSYRSLYLTIDRLWCMLPNGQLLLATQQLDGDFCA